MAIFELTAKGRYYKVYIDGIYLSQHTTEREAIENAHNAAVDNQDALVTYRHEYEVEVVATNAGHVEDTGVTPPVDLPPSIISTPAPSFTEGISNTYDMTQHVSDDGLSAISYSINNTLPNGLSFDANSGILSYDGIGSASVSQHQLIATDSVGSDVSSNFNISIIENQSSGDWDARVAAATGGGTITNFNTEVDALFSLDADPNGNNAAEVHIKKSGNFSYKVPILNTDTTLSGEKSLWLFNDHHALAPGEDIYIQFRQYIPAYMMDYIWEGTRSGGVSQGFKSAIVSSVHSQAGGNGSNTSSELVLQERIQSSFPSGYHQDGNVSAFHWADYDFLNSGCESLDRQYQPVINRGVQSNTPVATDPSDQITRGQTCRDNAAQFGPFHSYVNNNWGERGRADPLAGGVPFHKNPGYGNWITFYQHIKIDAGGQTAGGNTWECWVAHDGESYTQLFSRSDVELGAVPIVGIWLVCYRSNGLGNSSRRNTFTCYDELIVSSSPITVPSEEPTTLKVLADSMAPGTWAQLSTTGWDTSLPLAFDGFQLLDYGDKGVYDSIGKKVHLIHGGHQTNIHHVVYDEATNSWSTINFNVPNPGSGHGYNCVAIDVDRRKIAWRGYNQNHIDIYDLDTDTWDTSNATFSGQYQVASSLTYNENLGVFQFWDERQGLVNYDHVANILTTLVPIAQTDTIGANSLHIASDYSPKQRKTVFGGGDGSAGMGSVDIDGSFNLESNTPFDYGPTRARLTHDPISGDFMMMSASTLHRKNPITGIWFTEHNMSGGPNFSENAMSSSWDLVAVPIYAYGVTMWCKTNDTGTSGEVWLYKANP